MKRLNKTIVVDPDNLFWGITDSSLIPQRVLSLYESVKDKLDTEIRDFRFSKELTAIYIDPTDRCNANCPYCYIPQKVRKAGRSMTRDELNFILKKLAAYFKAKKRKAVIIFHASEPLLVKDIIFEAIKTFSREFKFGLQTNALLLEREDVEFLKKHRVGVGISLDSSSPAINNQLRRTFSSSGNFEAVVRALEWFDGYEGLNIITTITKSNVTGLPGIVKFLHSKKVPCVLLNPVRLTQKSSRSFKPNWQVMYKYFIQAVDQAIELSKHSRSKIVVGNFTNTILAIVAPVARRLMCDISPCGGGRCFFTITAKGEMIPCGEFIGLKGFSGGNIFSAGIKRAMESPAFKRIRNRYVEKIAECKDCVYRNICGAPCPAELHSLGNMHQPSVFCEFYKKTIEYAFRIISEGKEKYCLRKEGLGNLEYEYKLS